MIFLTVGTSLPFDRLVRAMDELVGEGIRTLDFGFGDAHYKQRFGEKSRQETTIQIFGSGLNGSALSTTMKIFFMIDTIARRIIKRVGYIDNLKKRWRARLSNANK